MDITHKIREALKKEGKLVKRVASEASRPKSLLGKHHYLMEQFMIRAFGNKVFLGVSGIYPEVTTGGLRESEEFYKIYPKKARYALIKGQLKGAREILEKDLGV
jgi:hypothetical protein